jgi:hypothetical protein
MPPIQPNGDGENDQKILDQVVLEEFIADPYTIEPFSSSTITWKVMVPKGADADVWLTLNETPVQPDGSMVVSPQVTGQYALKARVGSRSKTLGTITVQVDVTKCVAMNTTLLPQYIVGTVEEMLQRQQGIYFDSGQPPVTAWITDGLLHVNLHVKKEVHDFPDPTVDIRTTFGLAVEQAAQVSPVMPKAVIVPADETISSDVSFPWPISWLAAALLAPLIAQGKQEANQQGADMIASLCSGLLTPFFRAPSGLFMHDVELYVDTSLNKGVFQVGFCPPYRAPTKP